MAHNFSILVGSEAVSISGITAADAQLLQSTINKAVANERAIQGLQSDMAASNAKQHLIAAADLSVSANLTGLTPGVIYDCYYNAAGRYLSYDADTGVFSDDDHGAEAADIIPAQIKCFSALTATTVAAPRVYPLQSSFADFMKLSGVQTVTGQKTFSLAPIISAAQTIATVADDVAVRGDVVKGVDTRLQSAEGSITSLNSTITTKLTAAIAAAAPATADLVENQITFYPATNLFTAPADNSGV